MGLDLVAIAGGRLALWRRYECDVNSPVLEGESKERRALIRHRSVVTGKS